MRGQLVVSCARERAVVAIAAADQNFKSARGMPNPVTRGTKGMRACDPFADSFWANRLALLRHIFPGFDLSRPIPGLNALK
jgi:hypothetical protein